jgi:hypothetical protein
MLLIFFHQTRNVAALLYLFITLKGVNSCLLFLYLKYKSRDSGNIHIILTYGKYTKQLYQLRSLMINITPEQIIQVICSIQYELRIYVRCSTAELRRRTYIYKLLSYSFYVLIYTSTRFKYHNRIVKI